MKTEGEKDVSPAKQETLPVGATEKDTSSAPLRLNSVLLTFITCANFFSRNIDHEKEPKENKSAESTVKVASCKKEKSRKKDNEVKEVDQSVTCGLTEENSSNQGCFPCRGIKKAIRKRIKKKSRNKPKKNKQKKFVKKRTDQESESGKNGAGESEVEIKSLGFEDNVVEKASKTGSNSSTSFKTAEEDIQNDKLETKVTQITDSEGNTNGQDKHSLSQSKSSHGLCKSELPKNDVPPKSETNVDKLDGQDLLRESISTVGQCKSELVQKDVLPPVNEANSNKEDVIGESSPSGQSKAIDSTKDDVPPPSTEKKSPELVKIDVDEITIAESIEKEQEHLVIEIAESDKKSPELVKIDVDEITVAENIEKEQEHLVIEIAESDGTKKEDVNLLVEPTFSGHCGTPLAKDDVPAVQFTEIKPLGFVDDSVETVVEITVQEKTEKKENTEAQVAESVVNSKKEIDKILLGESSSSGHCMNKLLSQDDVSPRWSEKRLKSKIPRPDLKHDVVRLITTGNCDDVTFPMIAPIELWGLVDAQHPELYQYMKFIRRKDPYFSPGWVTDSIIDTYLKYICGERYHKGALILSSLTHQIYRVSPPHIASPENYDRVLVPLNITGRHWTLLILDKSKRAKIYLDSMSELKKGNTYIRKEIEELSVALAEVLKWQKSRKWPIVEPSHPFQQDTYNCGIFACVFARRAMNNKSLKKEIDPEKERVEIGNVLFSMKTVEQHLDEMDN